MIDLSTPFDWVITIAIFVIGAAAAASIGLALRTRDELTRAIMADFVFYAMVCMYLLYSMNHFVPLVYYIVLLAALVAGVLPTLSMSRIVSKGRR
ncbi:cation:proton antiporter [Corynebacterium phocae]|uniref:Cation:proton antiporter n=1 Tax=Corynebacterium phocae TaxID=161895 RepID=A0A1L7D2F4_9CORY|nr:cation:proton antiporter [Corynebacterium phocae]APT92294.1 cation:proton antiporter [Corynebacterium phocae]KAA8725328.1 cation:proton antiporter [Corynebacterium phocae]